MCSRPGNQGRSPGPPGRCSAVWVDSGFHPAALGYRDPSGTPGKGGKGGEKETAGILSGPAGTSGSLLSPELQGAWAEQ